MIIEENKRLQEENFKLREEANVLQLKLRVANNQIAYLESKADELADACKVGIQFVAKHVADTSSEIGKRALNKMNAALRQYENCK